MAEQRFDTGKAGTRRTYTVSDSLCLLVFSVTTPSPARDSIYFFWKKPVMDTCLLALPRAVVPFLGPFRSSLGSFLTVAAGGLCTDVTFILLSSSLSVHDSLS